MAWEGQIYQTWVQPDFVYGVFCPFEGHLTLQIDHSQETLHLSPAKAAIFTPAQSLSITSSSQGQGMLLCLNRASVNQVLTKLLEAPCNTLLTFQSELELTTAFGRSFRQELLCLWEEASRPTSEFVNMTLLEKIIIASLLQGHPHSCSQALWSDEMTLLQRYVRNAQEFILANADQPLTLGDVATMVGVSGRLLEKAFARHCCCSPMQFLKQARLQRVREDLCNASPQTTITNIMMRYGFLQGGKFARAYREMFGELPSETLKHHRKA
jgi:AraC-like DNA-binding protein